MFLKEGKIGLRPVKEKDAGNFIKILHNENVNKYLANANLPILSEEEKKWIKNAREEMENGEALHLSIVLKPDDLTSEVIGECSMSYLKKGGFSPEAGIFLAEEHWGNNYGKKAMTLLIDFVFNHPKDFNRISSAAIEYNEASLALHKSLGFTKEGEKRNEISYRGKKHNLIIFGLLEEEWQSKNSGE